MPTFCNTADGFRCDGKALVARENSTGDLILRGYAAVWDGLDVDGENFTPGAFTVGIRDFLNGTAPLCYHHKPHIGLGVVQDLREDAFGLRMVARLDFQPEGSAYRVYYDGVKSGSIRGLSVGGYFTRAGGRIVGARLTEVSVTPVAKHAAPQIATVEETKALAGRVPQLDMRELTARLELLGLRAELTKLTHGD